MQTDGNSFGGNGVLDSFNMVNMSVMKTAFKVKNMKSEFFGIFIMKPLNVMSD